MNTQSTILHKTDRSRLILILSLVLFLISSCKTTKEFSKAELSDITIDLVTLADDDMEGRETGTPGEIKASEYIAKRMNEIGLLPKGDGTTYFQRFSKKIKSNPHALEPSEDDDEVVGRNVVGFIDNGKANTVIVGAHYDHLGYGSIGSLHIGEPEIHNGADDNASGIAAMLDLAKNLKKDTDASNNYLFIAFSGEEQGLWGSNYFAKNPTIDIKSANYMFNMDMVGRLKPERTLAVYGVGTSPIWKDALKESNKQKFKFVFEESGIGPSDHTSFYLVNVPVLHFFTGQHSEYHKPEDDSNLINYQGIGQISDFLHTIIMELDDDGKLAFTKTKDKKQEAMDFKVTLGVIPDYLFDGKGMRIDGVRDGRPAHAADMEQGDVVVKMGDLEIVDMMGYMKALSTFEGGQTIMVTIVRDGKEIKKSVTFD